MISVFSQIKSNLVKTFFRKRLTPEETNVYLHVWLKKTVFPY